MNAADIEKRVLEAFLEVAPDVDAARLKRDVPFRDQFDFDSMDTLTFAIGLHKAFDSDVPDADYRRPASLASSAAYVCEALARKS